MMKYVEKIKSNEIEKKYIIILQKFLTYTRPRMFWNKKLCFQWKLFPDKIINEIVNYKNHESEAWFSNLISEFIIYLDHENKY